MTGNLIHESVRSIWASLTTVVFLFVVGGCQAPQFGEPGFDVDWSQHQALYRTLNKVRREARELRFNTGTVSRAEVRDMLADQDDRIREILDEDQWLVYDTRQQRDYLTRRLYSQALENDSRFDATLSPYGRGTTTAYPPPSN